MNGVPTYFEELMIVKKKISLYGGSTKLCNISNEYRSTYNLQEKTTAYEEKILFRA